MAPQVVNWQAVIEAIAAIEAQGKTIPDNKQTKRYVRLQRFVRKHGHGQSRDGTLRIAQEFGLTWRQARNLYVRLGSLVTSHDIDKVWTSKFAANAVKRELKRVEKSIKRIDKFQSTHGKNSRQALNFIVYAAERWAEKQDVHTLRRYGFECAQFEAPVRGLLSGLSPMHPSSVAIIHSWFELAPLIHQFATAAMKGFGTKSPKNRRPRTMSSIIRLVGGWLPDLYEQVTGKRYRISKPRTLTDSDHDVVELIRAANVGGVRFVGMALDALGLDRLSPDTIASNHQRYLRCMR